LKEVSEQQTATSLVLRVISSSPGDVEPVFAAMLEDAVEVEPVGEFELKGIRRSLAAYNVVTGHQKI
jgi:hypothetical protein